MLPALAARVGTAGVVKYIGEGYTYVDSETLHRLMCRTKADADVIIDAAVDYVELNSQSFPSYDASSNIRRSVNIDAGIVLELGVRGVIGVIGPLSPLRKNIY